MKGRVLHLLSQRPLQTGSGITLDALVRHAAAAGWEQHVVVGVPADDPEPEVAQLPRDHIHPLVFEKDELPFAVPGMSDVMPYRSTRFCQMQAQQLDLYRRHWRRHLQHVLSLFHPDVIHSHHIWLLSSMIKTVTDHIPVVSQCHATGFRQMSFCPDLAEEVIAGCRKIDHFVVSHQGHAKQLQSTLNVPMDRIHVVSSGFREELFHSRGRTPADQPRIIYVGKYSAAKGVPWLLTAFERTQKDLPRLELHIVGSGAGAEADGLAARMRTMAPSVILHGQLEQPRLAELMRQSDVCVLPSFYEGMPLVLVEALACGCRLVATSLPGILEKMLPALKDDLDLVPLPRMAGPDTPVSDDLPAFVDDLTTALRKALAGPPVDSASPQIKKALRPFRWASVFQRVESIWRMQSGTG